jgi:hypothetical protein
MCIDVYVYIYILVYKYILYIYIYSFTYLFMYLLMYCILHTCNYTLQSIPAISHVWRSHPILGPPHRNVSDIRKQLAAVALARCSSVLGDSVGSSLGYVKEPVPVMFQKNPKKSERRGIEIYLQSMHIYTYLYISIHSYSYLFISIARFTSCMMQPLLKVVLQVRKPEETSSALGVMPLNTTLS